MHQQSSQCAEHLRGVEADERVGAEQRVQRGMVFFGGQNLRLTFCCTVHFATSWFRALRVKTRFHHKVVRTPKREMRLTARVEETVSRAVRGRVRTFAAPTARCLPITDR